MINIVRGYKMRYLYNLSLLWVLLATSAAGQTIYDLTKVKFVTSNVVVAVGNSGAILRSANGGTSWSPVSSPTPYALRGLCFSDANASAR